MLLLDDGWSCEGVAEALYLDDDTVRVWRKTYDEGGLAGLQSFERAAVRVIFARRRKRC